MTERNAYKQRADLTYKANRGKGRHGWLRLTPAYSLNLVRERLAQLPEGSQIIEPFSGSGTTPLVCEELGLKCYAREINPFLVWLGNAKLAEYDFDTATIRQAVNEVVDASRDRRSDAWRPNMFKIEKWWNPPTLDALSLLKENINHYEGQIRDILNVALCRILISHSSAAFNHQSMSFKDPDQLQLIDEDEDYRMILADYTTEANAIIDTLEEPLAYTAKIHHGDSRQPFDPDLKADMVITSPPYANRMSYIRELRPYMYWMNYLETGEQAGELDWQTIGGTWGSVGTKLRVWQPNEESPIDKDLQQVCDKILNGKSGEILSPYVNKYFYDMWQHFKSITPAVKTGGQLCYIVGNSTFSGTEVPAHTWYATMMKALGYTNVEVEIIRKRNSNKQLYEYAVKGTKA